MTDKNLELAKHVFGEMTQDDIDNFGMNYQRWIDGISDMCVEEDLCSTMGHLEGLVASATRPIHERVLATTAKANALSVMHLVSLPDGLQRWIASTSLAPSAGVVLAADRIRLGSNPTKNYAIKAAQAAVYACDSGKDVEYWSGRARKCAESAKYWEGRQMEPQSEWRERVKGLTGYDLERIRIGDWEEVGQILARRGDEHVCTCGYPDYQDEDGYEYWTKIEGFVRVFSL